MTASATPPQDPYKTQPLTPVTQALARPVRLPLAAILGLAIGPVVLLAALALLWAAPRQPVPTARALLPSPTLGVPRAAPAPQGLPRAVVAYDAPAGRALGALEPGRAYRVVAHAGLAWVQIDVALAGEAQNLVWVAAGDVPEVQAVAGLADLATPAPTATARVILVAAPAPEPAPLPPGPGANVAAGEPAPLSPLEAPTAAYLVPPATPAPRSVVVVDFPTPTPCSVRDLGLSLLPCNGYQP